MDLSSVPIPRLRGRLHQIAFFVSIPAGVALIAMARTARPRFAAIVFALSLAGLYGTSAAYHRVRWSKKARARLRRADHSMIYLLIAGSYTAFSLLTMHGAWTVAILSVVWTGAIAGILLKILRIDRAPFVGSFLYIALGWVAMFAMPEIVRNASVASLVLLITGGVVYTLGAIVLLRRRPDPNPLVFGFHEVWHSMVIGASVCHYVSIMLLVLSSAR